MHTDEDAEEADEGYEFDWDEENEEHIARHGVEWWEAEEVLLDAQRFPLSRGWYRGEYRYGIAGETREGRRLVVVFTRRAGKLRVVTARLASPREIRLYERNQ